MGLCSFVAGGGFSGLVTAEEVLLRAVMADPLAPPPSLRLFAKAPHASQAQAGDVDTTPYLEYKESFQFHPTRNQNC